MAEQIDREKMKLVPQAETREPFSKINYWDKPDGSGRMVLAFIKADVTREGSRMGIAIDGSGSMEPLFGKKQVVAFLPPQPNHVKPAAQAMSSYLASKSADGKVAVVYWAVGAGGKDIQVIGDLTTTEAEKFDFGVPANYGTGTQLLPALKYFTDGVTRKDLKEAKWGMYIFITDGQIEDMDEVKKYCTTMAKDIEAGRRNDIKLVIIGLGDQVAEDQLEELDNLETGTDVDLWNAMKASEMKDLMDIFSEVADESMILVPADGVVRDESGSIVVNYRDTGLPAKLEFTLPRNASKAFSLEVGGNTITQPMP